MSRALKWTLAAEGDLRHLDSQVRKHIRQAVYCFADTGYGDIVKLQGVVREWRLWVGDWRIRFTEDPSRHTIIIRRVRPRGEAYRCGEIGHMLMKKVIDWAHYDRLKGWPTGDCPAVGAPWGGLPPREAEAGVIAG